MNFKGNCKAIVGQTLTASWNPNSATCSWLIAVLSKSSSSLSWERAPAIIFLSAILTKSPRLVTSVEMCWCFSLVSSEPCGQPHHFKVMWQILGRHKFNRTMIMSLIWPVSAPPAGEARSSPCPPSGCGVKSPSSRCLSSAWRNLSLSPPARAERCGPQSSPQEYWKRAWVCRWIIS